MLLCVVPVRVVRWLLCVGCCFVVCCWWFAVRCLLFVAGCVLFVCCLLFAVRCVLFLAVGSLLFFVWCPSFAVFGVRCLLLVVC